MDNSEDYVKISPRYDIRKLCKPTFTDYLDIFEDRVQGWIIDSAQLLTKYEHAGWSVLHILIVYFELIAIFQSGEDSDGRSEKFFTNGLLSVFPDIDTDYPEQVKNEIIKILYKELRCGLYHTGLAKRQIWLKTSTNPITIFIKPEDPGDGSVVYKVDMIGIDGQKLTEAIQRHFENYVCQLRDLSQTELRDKFSRAFKSLYS